MPTPIIARNQFKQDKASLIKQYEEELRQFLDERKIALDAVMIIRAGKIISTINVILLDE